MSGFAKANANRRIREQSGVGSPLLPSRVPHSRTSGAAKKKMATAGINPAQELELWLGPGTAGSTFATREELEAAWEKNRDRLLRECRGRRPMAWWEFDTDVPHPGIDRESSVLFEAGVFTKRERDELVALWRHEFNVAHKRENADRGVVEGAHVRCEHEG